MVSGNTSPAGRPETSDRKTNPVTCDGRSMPFVSDDEAASVVSSNCGWGAYHPRAKVRGDMAQRHLDKKHKGRGLWL